jgi:hypothetical protein
MLCLLAHRTAARPVAAGTALQAGGDQRVAWLGGRDAELDMHGTLLGVIGLGWRARQAKKKPGSLWQPGLVQDVA